MSVTGIAMQAYQKAASAQRQFNAEFSKRAVKTEQEPVQSFGNMLEDSLEHVNNMQEEKSRMITDFASGKEQNVHELMISLQKAGLAMSMTSAVRSKVMSAYQELMRMQF